MTTKTRTIPIFFNQTKHDGPAGAMTGTQLKTLFGVPSGDRLFRRDAGDDTEVADSATATLKPGNHFYALPTDVSGG